LFLNAQLKIELASVYIRNSNLYSEHIDAAFSAQRLTERCRSPMN